MILFSAGVAAAAAAAARHQRKRHGGPDPTHTRDLSRLVWGEVVAVSGARWTRLTPRVAAR